MDSDSKEKLGLLIAVAKANQERSITIPIDNIDYADPSVGTLVYDILEYADKRFCSDFGIDEIHWSMFRDESMLLDLVLKEE